MKAGGKKMRWRSWLASEGRLALDTMARAQDVLPRGTLETEPNLKVP